MDLRKLTALIRKEMLVLLRERQTIPLLFIMPMALIFFLSLALQGVYMDKLTGRQMLLIIENESRLPTANLLEQRISANKMIQRVRRPSGFNNDKLFETGRAHAVIFIPKGFDEGLKPVEMEFDPVLDAGYKAAVRMLVTGLTVEVVMGIDDIEGLSADFIVEKTQKDRTLPGPLQNSVPGWSIFAMFFIAIPMSIGFLREKNDGTLQRIFTYPVSPVIVILGKLVPYYLINLMQFALMLIVGIYIMPLIIEFPFTLGAHPWHLIPVTLVVAAASTGFGVMVAALARAPEQSSALAATGAVLMAVFGGIMVPYAVMPLVMKKLALISPMYWAHQAYLDIFSRETDFFSLWPKLTVLMLFALLCFYIAGRRVKWM